MSGVGALPRPTGELPVPKPPSTIAAGSGLRYAETAPFPAPNRARRVAAKHDGTTTRGSHADVQAVFYPTAPRDQSTAPANRHPLSGGDDVVIAIVRFGKHAGHRLVVVGHRSTFPSSVRYQELQPVFHTVGPSA